MKKIVLLLLLVSSLACGLLENVTPVAPMPNKPPSSSLSALKKVETSTLRTKASTSPTVCEVSTGVENGGLLNLREGPGVNYTPVRSPSRRRGDCTREPPRPKWMAVRESGIRRRLGQCNIYQMRGDSMTKGLTKSIGKIAFYVLLLGLFVYAASRSLDFIQSTLPPDQKIIGFLGLFATEGGSVIWLTVYLKEASGHAQKATSFLIAIADMIGSIGLFTFDTLYRSGQNGAIAALTPDDIRNVILVIVRTNRFELDQRLRCFIW